MGLEMTETRNVIDFYHYWETDAIKADLDSKRHNFSIVCTNLNGDFNIATVIRNSNAFLAHKIFIYGNRKYDKRGTVGTYHYERFHHVKRVENNISELEQEIRKELSKDGITKILMIGIDNVTKAFPIETFEFQEDIHYVFFLGEEQLGLPQEILELCNFSLFVRQYGSVRSLNVGTISGIIMYEYCRQL